MSDAPLPIDGSSLDSADRRDQACDAFEAAWKAAYCAGSSPVIEEYLAAVPSDERPALLRELLALDIDYLRRAGEQPHAEDYRDRFPAHLQVILAALADQANDQSTDQESADSAPPGDAPIQVLCPGLTRVGPPESTRMGDYQILDELGRGGMGIVYRAFDRKRNKIVALKTMRGVEDKALYRFKQEFRALADIVHPNLVSLHELVFDGREWFFTMELIEGTNFLAYVSQGGAAELLIPTRDDSADVPSPHSLTNPLAHLDKLRDAVRQLAEGLATLHRAGKLHRDVKPSNALVTPQGRVVLLDFGLAAELDAAGLHQSTQQRLVGTIAYMAPEQAACQPVSKAGDWYSVGVMLYQALTCRLPFSGPPLQVIQAKCESDPRPPREIVPGTPEDLNDLCMALLSRDPAARPLGEDVLDRLPAVAAQPRSPLPARPPVNSAPGLVGRASHLAALADAFAASRQGRAVTVHLHGRSGIGKSALVQHFLDGLAERREAVVLAGRCYERESVPYKALDSLIDALARYLGHLPSADVQRLLPREIESLGRVFPVLRRVAAVAEAPRRQVETLDQQELRQRAFAALRELLERLGDRVALVLSIDDLQWGDVDSAALLAEILRPPDPPVCLFLACYRSEDAGTSPLLRAFLDPQATEQSSVERRELAVEALAPNEARGLALALLGSADDETRAQVEAVVRESGGSPFFLRELMRHLREGEGSANEVSLGEVLRSRVARLPEPACRLLEVIAVAGKPLPEADACRAAGLAAGDQGAVAVLRSQQLIRRTGNPSGQEVETYHDRIRETVLANLPSPVLVGHHRRLAETLEATGTDAPEFLALHFRSAGAADQAAHYYALAAARAADALAFDRAAELYRLALELRSAEGNAARLLRTKLGDALANAGRGAESAEQYLLAVAGADAQEAIDLNNRAAMQYLISGHIDEGLAGLRTVLTSVGMSYPSSPRRALWALILRRVQLWLRGLGFRERAATSIPITDLTRIDICWSAATGLGLIDPIRSASFQACNLLLALQAGEPSRITRALALEAMHRATEGICAARVTQRLLQQAEALAHQIDLPYAKGIVSLARAMTLHFEGRWPAAEVLWEQAERSFHDDRTVVAWELDTVKSFSLWTLLWQGKMADLRRRSALQAKEARERGDRYAQLTLGTSILPIAQLAEDDAAGAQRDLDAVVDFWPRRDFCVQHFNAISAQIQIYLYCGKGRDAFRYAQEYEAAIAGSLLMRVQFVRILMVYSKACAALGAAEMAADPSPLLRAIDRDIRQLEREKAPWATALARLIACGSAAIRGDTTRTATQLASAANALDDVAMHLYAVSARRHLGKLLGGEKGRELVAHADVWMAEHGVVNPARIAHMYAPGFGRVAADE